MTRTGFRRWLTASLAASALLMVPGAASAHFIWITVEPEGSASDRMIVRTFLNEEPEPGGPEFLKLVRGLRPTVDGHALPTSEGTDSLESHWVGAAPRALDVERDLGIKTRDGVAYRLYYTARAQASPVAPDAKEAADKLRARLVTKDGKTSVQILFDAKPVARARIKVYPKEGDPTETTSDDAGLATVAGLAEGDASVWASWVEAKPGNVDGKPFAETRYYATLTVPKRGSGGPGASTPTAFATMPPPAVNSFGGAVAGGWLYVYSGHAGTTHEYSVETTARHFRRLNLGDRTTWEDLPMPQDVQGVALVSDGKSVYRVGGMSARNPVGKPHDLLSVTSFARFDPETKTWTNLADLPAPRSTHDAVIVGRKVYAVGGWTMKGAGTDPEYLHDAVVFDLDQPQAGWTSIPQPFRRRALAAAELGGKVYVLGGLNDAFKIERRVDVYDPQAKTWTTAADLPGPGDRDGFAASAFGVDGHLYANTLSGLIHRLDPKTGWEPVGALAQARNTHRLLPGPAGSLLAVGGNFRGKQTSLIERIPLPTTPSPAARTAQGN